MRMLPSTDDSNGTDYGNSTNSTSGNCSTEVIGDVTPFSFTTPHSFFDGDDCDYGLVGSGDAGKSTVQGVLLTIVAVVQKLMHTPSIVWAMGLANLVSGCFGGMGGDAMIGVSTINCLNGGRGRFAPTVAAVGVMACTMA